ncbi:MAG: AAA domain-containing protein [Deltaproteobacteria bacterium]|nr:AAA domain-containing protein [Deltaproteobacteria bacterium]
MRHETSQAFVSSIVDLLIKHPVGLRTDQIRSALGREGLNHSIADIARTLRELSESKKIRFENQKWIYAKAASAVPVWKSKTPSPVTVHKLKVASSTEVSLITQSRYETKRIVAIPFKPRRTRVDNAISSNEFQSGDLPTGWDLFRKLAPYYRECLHTEEKPNMIMGAEKANERFLALTTSGVWWPSEEEAVSFSIPMTYAPSGFLKALAKRGDNETFIGYPVSVIPTKENDPLVQPIFTLSCRIQMLSGGLEIFVPPQMPDINVGWFERYFKDQAEANNFLKWIGIKDFRDDPDLELSIGEEFLEISSAASRYMAFIGKDKCRTIVPETPATSISLDSNKALSQNAIILFLSDLTRYSKGAIKELSELSQWEDADLEKTSLAYFLNRTDTATCENTSHVLSPMRLNEDQLNAVREALNSNITVITGPPGTGKSQAVAAIMASIALSGGNAILASKNHKALDAIEERLGALTADRTILVRASRPWGTQRAFDLKTAINAALSRNAPLSKSAQYQYKISGLTKLDTKRWQLYQNLVDRDQLESTIAHNQDLILDLNEIIGAQLVTWAQSRPETIQIPHVKNELSWLEKLPIIGEWINRLRRKHLLRQIIKLSIPWDKLGLPRPNPENAESCLEKLFSLQNYQALVQQNGQFAIQLNSLPASHEALSQLMRINDQIMESSMSLLRDLPNILDELNNDERGKLSDFKGSISVLTANDTSDPSHVHSRNMWEVAAPIVLKHFPLWAVTNLSASRVPFMPALFDYLIIDEASACDIPSAIPLFARAKRAVIVGDPAQLQHVTKISVDRERELLNKNNLLKSGIGRYTHRENSVFNLASSASKVSRHLLREHYRCHVDIADYFNQAFYGGRLRVMTNSERLITPNGVSAGLHWTNITGPITSAKSGCYSQAEIDATLSHLKDLFENKNFSGTIGVVTAFREQANRLMDSISNAIPTDTILKANLGAFTAHQFQGDARDVIVLSLCAGPDIPAGSLAFLSQTANLMNVAVSRARAVCHVFGNLEFAKNCGISHISALAGAWQKSSQQTIHGLRFESPWEERLYEALTNRGLDPIPQYPLAGRRLDLGLIDNDIKLDIEVDGDAYHRNPDGSRKSSDLWRDFQISSLGWKVKRFWVYQLKENMEACVDDIVRSINN